MNVSRRFMAMVFPTTVVFLSAIVLTASPAPPAQYAPPPSIKPSAEILKKIEERKDKLGGVLRQFRQLGVKDPVLADIEVYYKAALWIIRHDEFYHKDAGEWTVEALEPEIAVVTNIDLDHHATFGSRAEVAELLEGWLARAPQAVRGWELEPVAFPLAIADAECARVFVVGNVVVVRARRCRQAQLIGVGRQSDQLQETG